MLQNLTKLDGGIGNNVYHGVSNFQFHSSFNEHKLNDLVTNQKTYSFSYRPSSRKHAGFSKCSKCLQFLAMFLFFVETLYTHWTRRFDWICLLAFWWNYIVTNPSWDVLTRKKLDPLEAYVPAVILTPVADWRLG